MPAPILPQFRKNNKFTMITGLCQRNGMEKGGFPKTKRPPRHHDDAAAGLTGPDGLGLSPLTANH
jgi:hypothetical protein